MRLDRLPRRISTVPVLPTDGDAVATTSSIASSRSTGAPRAARPGSAVRAGGAGGAASGEQTSQHGWPSRSAVGAPSPKWRRIARRRHSARSTNAQIERYWRQRALSASAALARHTAAARP